MAVWREPVEPDDTPYHAGFTTGLCGTPFGVAATLAKTKYLDPRNVAAFLDGYVAGAQMVHIP